MDPATQMMIRNLEQTTGKTFEQWIVVARKSGKSRHGEIVKLLKEEHGLTHGYANLITHSALQSDARFSDGASLVDAQYSGPKAALRPIYDRILGEIEKFGRDVEISPKKGYVSLRRKKQFGIVQPSTAARLDVGINLKGTAPTPRLETSGSFNAMVSHRVRVSSAEEVDRELVDWLRRAYEQS